VGTKLANLTSYIFHPGLMPTALLATLYFISPYIVGIDGYSLYAKLLLLSFVFAYSFIFPSIFVFWLLKRKMIASYKLDRLKDRRLPYLFSVTSMAFITYFFYDKGSELYATAIILGFTALAVVVVALISLKWQISAHAAGISTVLGTFLMLRIKFDEASLNIPFIMALFLVGIILSSRLKLNAHTGMQVAAGFFVGLITSMLGALYI
jgi:membrane-associated phospholipid phosphatase